MTLSEKVAKWPAYYSREATLEEILMWLSLQTIHYVCQLIPSGQQHQPTKFP